MAGIRGQALAHLDKSFENDKLSSGGKGTKANKQKLSSSSPSSPSSSTTATPANAAAPTSTHDRDIAEKSSSSVKRVGTGNSTVSSSSLHSNSSAQSPIRHNNNNNKEYKDISRMISTSLMTTGAFLGSPNTTTTTATSTTGRGRSGSSASVNSNKSNKSKNSVDSATPSNHSHHHHHIRLPSLPLHTPSFLKRRKHQGNATASLDSLSSSLPPHLRTNSSSSSLSSPVHKPDPHPHHAILMVPQHDIHIAFPHPVPSHNVFIAGTWTVPGHQPWEKLSMTHIPETDTFEITLNVQELEDISDYLDEDGYLHHELLDHPPEEHHHHEEESHSSTTTAPTRISKRQRIRRFFGRARSSSSSSTTSPPTHDNNNTQGSAEHINSIHKHEDTAYHHQSKDGMPLPLSKEYRYQYKFVVDDEWLCDPQRPQVHDGHGHWNHELVVVLMEQNPALDTTHELLHRSRSSNTSESSVYSKPLPIPVVQISEHKEEKEKEGEKMEVIVDEETKDIPDQSSDEVSMAVAAARQPAKAKETYEAVLLFEERDDLSDGEGRSKSQALSEDEEDDQDEITSEAPAADHDQNHNIGHTVEVEEVEKENKESEEAVEIESKSLPVDEPEIVAVPTSSAFVLLEAADPEERTHTATMTSVLEEEEIQDPRTPPSSMQILTDATTLATGVKLLSPPLTPTSMPLADADKDMETPAGMMSPESDSESSYSKELPSTFMGTFALLTPRTESSPFTRVSYEADTTRSLEAAIVAHESKQEQEAEANEHETFDVLDDHSSLRSSRYSSSSSLSSMGSSMVEASHDRSRSEEERKGLQPPEKYPNLLWSFCKTTVVVSAAVVVLSLGLGRKRD